MKIYRHIALVVAALLTGCLAAVSCSEKPEDTPETCDITLHSNSSVPATRTVKAAKGEIAGEPTWHPHLEGSLFEGWYLDEACTRPFDFETTPIDGPIDLYAAYVKEITLTDKGKVARVTGKTWNDALLNPNHTDQKWDLGGTDLGIIWEMADGRYGVAFGDTYGSNFSREAVDLTARTGAAMSSPFRRRLILQKVLSSRICSTTGTARLAR